MYLKPLWPWHSLIYLSDHCLYPIRISCIPSNGFDLVYFNMLSPDFRIGAFTKSPSRRLRWRRFAWVLRLTRLVAALTGFRCFILGFNSGCKSGPPFGIEGSKNPQVGRSKAAAIFFVSFSIRTRNFLKKQAFKNGLWKNWTVKLWIRVNDFLTTLEMSILAVLYLEYQTSYLVSCH